MCQWSAAEKPKSYLQKYLNAHLSQKSPHSCCVSDSWGQNQQFLGLRFRCSSSVWELFQAYLFCFNFSHLSMSFLRYSWELLYIELEVAGGVSLKSVTFDWCWKASKNLFPLFCFLKSWTNLVTLFLLPTKFRSCLASSSTHSISFTFPHFTYQSLWLLMML